MGIQANCFQDHECQPPQEGSPLLLLSEKHAKLLSLEESYDNLAIIIVKKKYFPDVKSFLELKGEQFELRPIFRSHNFKLSQYTGAIFHNLNYKDLISCISFSKQLEFEGKNTLVVNVLNYIKLDKETHGFSEKWVKNVAEWLHADFPTETLRVWEHTAKEGKDYYLETDSKTSLLYLYYVLHHYNQKAIFKNGPELAGLSLEERHSCWRITSEKKLDEYKKVSPQARVGSELKKKADLVESYLFDEMRLLFKNHRETVKILRDEEQYLECFELIKSKELVAFKRHLTERIHLPR
jgi:hypothetical protein